MATDLRLRQRDWLRRAMELSDLSATALAKKADLAQTTLTRFLGDPEHGSALSARTISAIEQASGHPFADLLPAMAVHEGDASPYQASTGEAAISSAIGRLTGGQNGVDPWRLRSDRRVENYHHVAARDAVDVTAGPGPGEVLA